MIVNLQPIHNYALNGCSLNFFSGNTGEGLPLHEHTFAHLTYCSAGSMLVRVAGSEQVMTKNTKPVELPANIPHEIEILESNTSFINVYTNEYSEPVKGVVIINGMPMRIG